MPETIAGYDYGASDLAPSPVTPQELRDLEASVLWTDDDAASLARAAQVLDGQIEDVLDVWYGFVGANPHLLAAFASPDGTPVDQYLARVRGRFGQWIRDTCTRPHDGQWLDYAQEIALRHTRAKKNTTDDVRSTPYVPLRHVIALIYPITATMRPFLAKGGDDEDTVDKMHQAWCKAVTLQVALWAQPYAGNDW
ncbi:protoglobin domain-containing protein [Streptomyces cavernicola]|uniref:Protoglobin domain-containing protein n=1 Tax=Streptomyces cavernicola TaxID=3043613 RepID=A0ABT6SFM8_9ACTN|nr:protoglobin domain-containing protein [Streptomyces sp. B-S-A6]MDI3406477.1 protoglobin domain-containing protein [Streptomyces sp. B-S-A6]